MSDEELLTALVGNFKTRTCRTFHEQVVCEVLHRIYAVLLMKKSTQDAR